MRRAAQAIARLIPAPLVGKSRVSMSSPVVAAMIAYTCLRTWVPTPTTNACECAKIDMAVIRTFLFADMVVAGVGRYQSG